MKNPLTSHAPKCLHKVYNGMRAMRTHDALNKQRGWHLDFFCIALYRDIDIEGLFSRYARSTCVTWWVRVLLYVFTTPHNIYWIFRFFLLDFIGFSRIYFPFKRGKSIFYLVSRHAEKGSPFNQKIIIFLFGNISLTFSLRCNVHDFLTIKTHLSL